MTSALTLEQLTRDIHEGRIDTVVVAFTDMQGRLQAKFIHGDFFLNEVAPHGTEGCNYLLAVDVEMNTVQGYDVSSWDTGYGDMVMRCDMDTLRYTTWRPGSALVIADLLDHHGHGVAVSPRQILQHQLNRLREMGMIALVGTELEFIVFDDSYEQAWDNGYRHLTPSNRYNVDYSMLGSARVEPLLRDIRLAMAAANLTVESAKGECNFGQHEIAFRFADAQTTCDNHVIYKTGAKEIAHAHGKSLTFMAKYNDREGNSCHIHLSFRGLNGELVLADDNDAEQGLSALGRAFIAGQLAHMRDLGMLYAPNINSYKRYQPGTFAPTAIKWGRDNRTCAYRLVGHGPGLRVENRVPGGDVNPYLAVAGMIAAGIDGIQRNLELEPAFTGNAYALETDRVPTTLRESRELWLGSEFILNSFGAEVQKHYGHLAEVEIDAFNRSVTDWERFRSFERM